MRNSLLAGLTLFLFACSHRAKGPDGQPLWFEVQSEHYVLRAATDEQTARDAAVQLERIREAFIAGSWHVRTETPSKVHVLLLEDQASLEEYLPRRTAGLTTVDALGAVLIVASASQDLSEMTVLKHEIAHAVQHQFLLRSPLWLAEGLAVYLETLELAPDSATLGRAHLGFAQVAAGKPLGIPRLMTAGPEIYTSSESAREEFYARSWVLVHLLVNRHREQFDAYLQRLAHAQDPQAAFAACCSALTASVLEQEAREYLHGGKYYMTKIPLPPHEHQLAVRTLRPAEVRATQAQFIHAAGALGSPGARVAAEKEARAALALDPGEPLAAVAICDTTSFDSEPCIAAARGAAQARPEDPRGFLLLSRALQPKRGPEWQSAIEKAIALAPEDPLALDGLAELRLTQGRFAEALPAAVHAQHNAPGSPQALDLLATVLAASGECDRSVAVEKRVLEVLPDSAPPDTARWVRARADELGSRCAAEKQARVPVTSPRKLACAGPGPRVVPDKRTRRGLVVPVHYTVQADGTTANVKTTGDVPPAVAKTILDFVRTCRFEPARRNGEPLPAEVDETFTLKPAGR